jgi:hypothetical protein
MKTLLSSCSLAACVVAGWALAAEEDTESTAIPALTLTAGNFGERVRAPANAEAVQLAPTGEVCCALAVATNQIYTFVVVARAATAAAARLVVRLDTNTLHTASVTATNWVSLSFSAPVNAGRHVLALAQDGAATPGLSVASVTITGGPVLPRVADVAPATPVAATNAPARPAWDQPVGR